MNHSHLDSIKTFLLSPGLSRSETRRPPDDSAGAKDFQFDTPDDSARPVTLQPLHR